MNDEEAIMNSKQAAEFLGVGERTIRQAARDGTLPGKRIGRAWRFSRRALLDWLSAR